MPTAGSTWRSASTRLPGARPAGPTALVHPLRTDNLADHTTLGQRIGTPIALDLSVLAPPGINQGFARFGQTDF